MSPASRHLRSHRRFRRWWPVAALAVLGSCQSVGQPKADRIASFTLRQPDGRVIGNGTVDAEGGTISLTVGATGLPPGPHGFHLHMVGACDGPGFTSAGAHLNPGQHQHGTENPAGSHLGDLPNLVASSDGRASLTTPLRGTRSAIEAALFDPDGTALVVHADPDDYRTDPTGNSGRRIACAVLVRG